MLNCLLIPLSWIYKIVVLVRHRLFDWGVLRSERFDVPIICIGNITVGGTGKTPLCEMVLEYMSRRRRVALLSRGYGRTTRGYLEVEATSSYREVGDEPLQIKRKFPGVLVVVCEKRAEAIRRIRAEHPGIDLIVMDDGFQHRYVEPKVNVVVVDATRPIQEDRMLPAGSLRDHPSQLLRASYFVVTKCPAEMSPMDRRILRKVLIEAAYQSIYFTRMEPFRPCPVFAGEADPCPDYGSEMIVLSGIGNPEPFLRTMQERYRVVGELTFEDHHVYRVRDMRQLGALLESHPAASVITTEKDAVKFAGSSKVPPFIRKKLYYQPINISFIEDSATDFLQKLEQDVSSDS